MPCIIPSICITISVFGGIFGVLGAFAMFEQIGIIGFIIWLFMGIMVTTIPIKYLMDNY